MGTDKRGGDCGSSGCTTASGDEAADRDAVPGKVEVGAVEGAGEGVPAAAAARVGDACSGETSQRGTARAAAAAVLMAAAAVSCTDFSAAAAGRMATPSPEEPDAAGAKWTSGELLAGGEMAGAMERVRVPSCGCDAEGVLPAGAPEGAGCSDLGCVGAGVSCGCGGEGDSSAGDSCGCCCL